MTLETCGQFLAHRRRTNTKPEITFFNQFSLNVMMHILTLMKLSVASTQIVFKRNNRHFVAFFDVIITLLKFS